MDSPEDFSTTLLRNKAKIELTDLVRHRLKVQDNLESINSHIEEVADKNCKAALGASAGMKPRYEDEELEARVKELESRMVCLKKCLHRQRQYGTELENKVKDQVKKNDGLQAELSALKASLKEQPLTASEK